MNPVRKVKNKINSQEGATLLIGLFFFIMCAVVAVIILAAATTASGSVGTLTSSQQAYYSATSAARVIKSQLQNKNNVVDLKKDSPAGTPADFHQLLVNGAASASQGNTVSYDMSFSLFNTGAEDVMKNVKGTFTMYGGGDSHNQYDIEINLAYYDKNKKICNYVVDAEASPERDSSGNVISVRWPDPQIKGGSMK